MTESRRPLAVRPERVGSAMVVCIDGSVDAYSYPAFEACLDQACLAGESRLVVELSRATYFASEGWKTILGAARRVRAIGGRFVLAGMPPHVEAAYRTLNLHLLIPMAPTVLDALKVLSRAS